MAFELTELQRMTLSAFVDTVVPPLQRAEDPLGFWGRKGTDLGVDQGVAEMLAGIPDPEIQGGLAMLLDAMGAQGFPMLSLRSRDQVMRNMALASNDAAAGIAALTGMALFLFYGAPDPQTGRNPNWELFGYPGPQPPPQTPKTISATTPEDGAVVDADVCVIGSGAGGGVIAGTLAQQGLKVCVLEAGGYFNEADFNGYELWAYQNLSWRGGPTPTADLNIALMAGACLGGGTVVNWTNCLRTTPWVREEWANHGLSYMTDPDYERHFDAVLERISGTDQCDDFNGPHQRIREGADRLGWSWHRCVRNTDPSTYSPETAAFMGFGDPTGSKQSTLKTYLQDASDAGADILVRTRADRVILENGRAAGVEATVTDPETGAPAGKVTIRSSHVVVAAGSLESPAILLRSGIGGPATGRYLRLHPSIATVGYYEEEQRAWWGAPQTLVCDEHAKMEDGHGVLIEGVHYSPGLVGTSIPYATGSEHKEVVADLPYGSTFIGLTRDRGSGSVVLDPRTNEGVPFYSVDDPLDRKHLVEALRIMTRLHHAAGAQQVVPLATGLPAWRRGDDIDEFVNRLARIPLGAGGHRLFSAHQMGSCRLGADPATSVGKPDGELHDTPGVWIGDASAFPTSSGTNPMLSIMALAHHTAETIGERAGTRAAAATTH